MYGFDLAAICGMLGLMAPPSNSSLELQVKQVQAQMETIRGLGVEAREAETPSLDQLRFFEAQGLIGFESTYRSGVERRYLTISISDGIRTLDIELDKGWSDPNFLLWQVRIDGVDQLQGVIAAPISAETQVVDIGGHVGYDQPDLAHVLFLEQVLGRIDLAAANGQHIDDAGASGVLSANAIPWESINAVQFFLFPDGSATLICLDGAQVVAKLDTFTQAMLDELAGADGVEDRDPRSTPHNAAPPRPEPNRRHPRDLAAEAKKRLEAARARVCDHLLNVCHQGSGSTNLEACRLWLMYCGC